MRFTKKTHSLKLPPAFNDSGIKDILVVGRQVATFAKLQVKLSENKPL
jgi:hypothetical protein